LIVIEENFWKNPRAAGDDSYLDQVVRGIEDRMAECLLEPAHFGAAGWRRYSLRLSG
jgi:hypothetical protein